MAIQRLCLYATGWEYVQSAALVDTPVSAVAAGTWSITASAARSGNYGLRLNPTSNRSAVALNLDASHYEVFGRIYVRFASFPGTNCNIVGVQVTTGTDEVLGIDFNPSTNKLRARATFGTTHTYGSDGPALSLDTWYRIDFKFTRPDGNTASRRLIEWYQATGDEAGSAQSSLDTTTGTNVTYVQAIRIGEDTTRANTGTYDYHLDDFYMGSLSSSGDYPSHPVGAGAVYAQIPTSDGADGDTPSAFTDDSANSPPVNGYSRIDEGPGTSTTDYIGQTTVGSGNYFGVGLTNSPADWRAGAKVHGINIRWAFNASGTLTSSGTDARYHISGVETSRSLSTLTTTLARFEEGNSGVSDGDVFSQAEVDAAYMTFGRQSSGTPVPRWHSAYAEVAYPTEPLSEGEGWDILMA